MLKKAKLKEGKYVDKITLEYMYLILEMDSIKLMEDIKEAEESRNYRNLDKMLEQLKHNSAIQDYITKDNLDIFEEIE